MLLLQLCKKPSALHMGQESKFSLALRPQPFNFPFPLPCLKESRWLSAKPSSLAEIQSRAPTLHCIPVWPRMDEQLELQTAQPAMQWEALLPSWSAAAEERRKAAQRISGPLEYAAKLRLTQLLKAPRTVSPAVSYHLVNTNALAA